MTIDPVDDFLCEEYQQCDEETEELNRQTNECEKKDQQGDNSEDVTDQAQCDRSGKWFNESRGKCEEFVDCSLRKSSISFQWRLDRTEN